MTSYHLNHINIRARDLEETRDFYRDVLGLEEGFRPPFPSEGHWMYTAGMPIIHISSYEEDSPNRTNQDGMGTGLDHFAMWGSGLAEQLATFEKHGVEYAKRLAGGGTVIQVFFHDPNGVQIELGYVPAAEGITKDNFDGELHS
jgi:catechol 2,3-dioxygenase-like lactoylglutathione lyase family enzyme